MIGHVVATKTSRRTTNAMAGSIECCYAASSIMLKEMIAEHRGEDLSPVKITVEDYVNVPNVA